MNLQENTRIEKAKDVPHDKPDRDVWTIGYNLRADMWGAWLYGRGYSGAD